MADEKTTEVPTTEQGTESTQEEPKQRSVKELMSLDTYQGMTDAEIESLIKYHEDMARHDELMQKQFATYTADMAAQQEAYLKQANESNDILKQLLAKPLSLGTIEVGD